MRRPPLRDMRTNPFMGGGAPTRQMGRPMGGGLAGLPPMGSRPMDQGSAGQRQPMSTPSLAQVRETLAQRGIPPNFNPTNPTGGNQQPFKKGGVVKKAKAVKSSASKRADGCATKGKTKGRMV